MVPFMVPLPDRLAATPDMAALAFDRPVLPPGHLNLPPERSGRLDLPPERSGHLTECLDRSLGHSGRMPDRLVLLLDRSHPAQ